VEGGVIRTSAILRAYAKWRGRQLDHPPAPRIVSSRPTLAWTASPRCGCKPRARQRRDIDDRDSPVGGVGVAAATGLRT